MHPIVRVDHDAPLDIRTSALPSPSDSVRLAGYGDALARHLHRWEDKVASGRATNGTAVALRAVEPWTTGNGQASWRFHVTPHPYVEHRAVRDLCTELRPEVDPQVVSPVWNSGCPLFLAVIDPAGRLLMQRRSATVAVAPNKISPVLTEGCAVEDLRPDLPVAMVQRGLAEELGLHAPSSAVAAAMAHTQLVFDPGQTQWGLFSLVHLDRLHGLEQRPAHDAWETSAWLPVPFTPAALRAFAQAHAHDLVAGGAAQVEHLVRAAEGHAPDRP